MQQFTAIIKENRQLCDSFFKIVIDCSHHTIVPQPGQFFTARITPSIAPLLRRPFAFSDYDTTTASASFIYQVRGSGTKLLRDVRPSAHLDIIAPLGNSFTLPPARQSALLVAGGIGLGPILFLATALQKAATPFQMIFGCRTAALIPTAVFDNLPVTICTDDGSAGFHGSVVDYLKSLPVGPAPVLYCCGPHPMLHACHAFALQSESSCYVSVEQTMACGVGACMGCAVKIHGAAPFARACKEGPVFSSRDIVWE